MKFRNGVKWLKLIKWFKEKKRRILRTRLGNLFSLKNLFTNEKIPEGTAKYDKIMNFRSTFYAESEYEVRNRLFDMRVASIDAEHKFKLTRNVTQLTPYAYRRTR